MFCVKCGQKLPDDVRFCPHCGQQLDVILAPEELIQSTAAVPCAELPQETPGDQQSAEPMEVTPSDPQPAEAMQEMPYDPQPVFPVDGTDYSQEPVYPAQGAYPYYSDAVPQSVENQPKKSGKKKLIITIVAAVLAVALLAGGVFFFVSANSPEAKLAKALNNSAEELYALLGNAETLGQMIDNAKAMEDGRTIALKYATKDNLEGYYNSEIGFSLQIDQDLKEKEMMLSAELLSVYDFESMPEYSYDQEILIDVYADQQEVMFTVSDYLDGYYSLPLDDFGKKILESELGELLTEDMDDEDLELLRSVDLNLFAQYDTVSPAEACPAEYEAFVTTVLVEKSEEKIPEANGIETVYSVTWNMRALADLINAYYLCSMNATVGEEFVSKNDNMQEEIEELTENMEDTGITVYVGISDDCAKAIYVLLEDDSEEYSLTLLLEGRENPWEDVVLYADEEEVMIGTLEQTEEGFIITLEAEGEALEILCDDEEKELRIQVEEEEPVILTYSADGGGLCIEYDYASNEYEAEYSYRFSFELLPLQKIERPEEATDLLSLTKEELEELLVGAQDIMAS